MLKGLNAIGAQPSTKRRGPTPRPTVVDRLTRSPDKLHIVVDALRNGVKTRAELLRLPISRSTLETCIAYLYDKNMIEKIPINPNNHRNGMSYKLINEAA